ncbi:Early nodulin-like protein 1 [Ananas comosus]|uniref:Early nodulin-like protein 1 n=1 Tax=Ananas comosus TaxID=4615 RepID=A0A199UM97_ANACO|nr:Early nodulin-like protein 1 [Ananas comosus]
MRTHDCRNAAAILILVVVVGMVSICGAYEFFVGGRDGWVPDPSEAYNHWAERNRFLVNDRLIFKYNKEEDSVLVVSHEKFNSCNTTDPYLRLDGGYSVFDLGRSGPFFFISGNKTRCDSGEKLVIVVLATRTSKNSPPPPRSRPSPAPTPRSDSNPPTRKATPPTLFPSNSSSSAPSSSSVLRVPEIVSFGVVALVMAGAFP